MTLIRQISRSAYVRVFRCMSRNRFKSFGRNVYVFPGIHFEGTRGIEIGDDVVLLEGSIITASQPVDGGKQAIIRIGQETNLGRRNQIYSIERIEIGCSVLTASNVYISDCTHSYERPEIPILRQPVRAIRDVKIGDGAWIGQNACIIGCSVGKNAVIGANAVVLQDVPDYSVAVGAPAKIVKRFNQETNEWIAATYAE